MKRGEIWTMAGGPGGASMLLPAVIVQEDGFAETVSIAVCPLASEPIDAPILRILAEPAPTNGLRNASRQPFRLGNDHADCHRPRRADGDGHVLNHGRRRQRRLRRLEGDDATTDRRQSLSTALLFGRSFAIQVCQKSKQILNR